MIKAFRRDLEPYLYYNRTMQLLRFSLRTLLFASLVCQFSSADPEKPLTQKGQSDKAPIHRSELLNQLESVLNRFESNSEGYAKKSDVIEMRSLLLQLRKELDGMGSRIDSNGGKVLELDQRGTELRRPGF